MLGMGAMTDPYIPLEDKDESVKKALVFSKSIWFWDLALTYKI